MHDIDDETRKEVLGEASMDEFKVIREYLEDIPKIKEEVHQTNAAVNDMRDRMIALEAVVREHDVRTPSVQGKGCLTLSC